METALAATGLTAFFTQMLAPLLLCSSIPLGIPPAPQDVALRGSRPSSASSISVGPCGVARPQEQQSGRTVPGRSRDPAHAGRGPAKIPALRPLGGKGRQRRQRRD